MILDYLFNIVTLDSTFNLYLENQAKINHPIHKKKCVEHTVLCFVSDLGKVKLKINFIKA
jgi:hypothetical protein